LGRVGHAECFQSELQSHALANRETAKGACVEGEETWSAEGVPRHVALHPVGAGWTIYRNTVRQLLYSSPHRAKRRRIEPEVVVYSAQHMEGGDLDRRLLRPTGS